MHIRRGRKRLFKLESRISLKSSVLNIYIVSPVSRAKTPQTVMLTDFPPNRLSNIHVPVTNFSRRPPHKHQLSCDEERDSQPTPQLHRRRQTTKETKVKTFIDDSIPSHISNTYHIPSPAHHTAPPCSHSVNSGRSRVRARRMARRSQPSGQPTPSWTRWRRWSATRTTTPAGSYSWSEPGSTRPRSCSSRA